MKKQPFVSTLKMFLGAILFTAGAFVARADAPGFIAYQGKLTTNDGTPVADSNYNVTFNVFSVDRRPGDAETGGLVEGSISVGVTTVNGVFSALIPVTPSTLQNGTARFLEMTYNGSAFLPRQQLVSAPYALAVAAGSVGTAEIQDGAVLESKINDGAVTNQKISSVAPIKISPGELGNTVIASSVAVNSIGYDQMQSLDLQPLYYDTGNSRVYSTLDTGRDFLGYVIMGPPPIQ